MRASHLHIKRKPAETSLPTAGEEHRGDLRVLSGNGTSTRDRLYFGRNNAGTNAFVEVATLSDTQTLTGKTATDLILNNTVETSGSTPSAARGTSAGSTAAVTISGNDTCGRVSVTPSGTGIAAGHLVTVTFTAVRPDTNYEVFLQETSAAAAAIGSVRVTNRTTSGFQINSAGTPVSGSAYSWGFLVVEW